jgi:hypothetical protein
MSTSLLTAADVQALSRGGLVVREDASVMDLVMLLVFFTGTVAALSYPFWRTQLADPPHMPSAVALFIGAFFLLFFSIALARIRAVWRPSNWLLRLEGASLLIHFRSYLNWRGSPDDRVVLRLPASEIDFLRPLGLGLADHTFKLPLLELHLRQPLSADIIAAVQTENRRMFGAGAVRSRSNHNPLQTSPDGRVILLNLAGKLKPTYAELLQQLKLSFRVEPPASLQQATVMAEGPVPLTRTVVQQVAFLKASGEEIEAIRLLRQHTSLSLVQARQALEGDVAQNLKHLLSPEP